MPRGDGTGPMGTGPMTGCAAGHCVGFAVPGFMNPGVGLRRRGGGRGFGGSGRGWRHRFYATGLPGWMRAGYAPVSGMVPSFAAPSKADQARVLKQQAELMEASLGEIKQRLAELEKSPQGN